MELATHPMVKPATKLGPCGASTEHALDEDDPVGRGQRCRHVGQWLLKGCEHRYCSSHASVIAHARDWFWGGREWR